MAHRKIEYVFGPPRPSTGHSLGISTLSLSSDVRLLPHSYGTLFTGGRDGRINAWSLSPETPAQGTQATRVSDLHTNWVSDLLVLSNNSVVSCSADTTVKLWNLESNDTVTIGHHQDYAQCLAELSPTTVVSGGLDERILGWDVSRPGAPPLFEIKTGHSVYALATVAPNLVVGGFPDGAVRIWDTRQKDSNYIAKFTGHTDSVRSLFVTGGDTVVSGSSDASVRVWSLRTGRVLKTLNQFNSSVWALTPTPSSNASDGSGRGGFYAGDRMGNIYHTDRLDTEPRIVVEHAVPEGGLKGLCRDPVTSNLWVSTPFTPDLRCINLHFRSEVEKIKGHRGLRRHRLINDKRRALVVDTAGSVAMVDLVSAKQLDFHRSIDVSGGKNIDQELDDILEEVNTMDVLDNWCQVQTRAGQVCVILDSRSINNTEVYLDDLIEHVAATPRTPAPSPGQSPFSTPIASPLSTPVGSGFFRQGRSSLTSPAVSRVPSNQSLAELAKLEQQQRQKQRFGTGKGNAKFYDPDEDDDDSKAPEAPASAASAGTAPSSAAQAPAAPTPHISVNDAEDHGDSETADDEIRINLGNYVLENLLRGVLERLKKEYEALPEPPSAKSSAHQVAAAGSGAPTETSSKSSQTPSDGKTERKRTKFLKMFGIGKNKDEETPNSSRGGTPVPTSAGSETGTNKDTQENPQLVKQRIQQQHQNDPESASFKEAWSVAVAHRSLQSADPEAPEPSVLNRRTRLVVTEIAPGAGAPTEIFSTTVGKLIDSKTEAQKIESILPGWVGDAVLLGKLNMKQATKIGFAVISERPDMPELTPDNTRLMAIAMLRVRKIMAYTVGQLQQHKILSAEASNHAPEDLISLSCLDSELTAHTTLATIRTRIWRKGGDVPLHYKLKKRV